MLGVFQTLLIVLLALLCLCSMKAQFGVGFALGCHKAEGEALLKFKRSLSDPTNRLSSWKGDDCCHWVGVGCDNVTGHVHILDLRNDVPHYYDPYVSQYIEDPSADHLDRLDYPIPGTWSSEPTESIELRAQKLDPSLAELRQLRYLDLSGNYFQGEIPKSVGSMKHLRYLNLSRAFFGGVVPPSLGNLSRLRALDLSDNLRMTVDNLHWLSGLQKLQYLDMGEINLAKAQDSAQVLGMLPSLLQLRLSDCFEDDTLSLSHAFFNSTWLSTLQYLDLSSNNVQGPLPHYFANMTSLRFLDLSQLYLEGSIPLWLRNLRALESINLDENSFSHVEGGTIMGVLGNPCKFKSFDLSANDLDLEGVEIVGPHDNFSKCITYDLESLALSWNAMTGSLPYWFGNLTTLKYLNLSRNKFHGPIPTSIGNLSSLQVLDLSHNPGLNGAVPSSLGGLTSLKVLALSNMSLTVALSDLHLAHLSGLDLLNLGYSRLELNFSSDWIPPFQLSQLVMKSCGMDGELPQWLQTQTKLITLDMSNNHLGEQILEHLGRYKNLSYLDLSSNLMQGVVSDYHLANLSSLYYLNLSFNALNLNFSSDWVPPFQLGSFIMRSCRIQGQLPRWIQAQYQLEILDLSNNSIIGPITHFGPRIFSVDLSHNLLSGTLPSACWGNSSALYSMSLSFNNLSGHIPMSCGLHSNLVFLNLNTNSFEGEIPPTLSRCNALQILDLGENKLSGKIPTFEGKSLPYLQILRLRTNQLVGAIPQELCSLPRLQILDLADNNLAGNIPRCFGHLNQMANPQFALDPVDAPSYLEGDITEVLNGAEQEYTTTLQYVVDMDLSCNGLVGSIPEGLTNLSGLIGLNLSYNHLTGRIPEKIGDMTSLESLDLSNNNISGTIPSSISMLLWLNHLNLSHNKLHGRIPTGQQLQALPDPSIYAGNLGLCGDPLPNKCSGNQGQQRGHELQEDQEQEDEDPREKALFYIVVMLGFGTGFWGVVGTLLVSKEWRYALFRRVEDIVDCLYVQVVVRINRLIRH